MKWLLQEGDSIGESVLILLEDYVNFRHFLIKLISDFTLNSILIKLKKTQKVHPSKSAKQSKQHKSKKKFILHT